MAGRGIEMPLLGAFTTCAVAVLTVATASPWTALHQWTPIAANITLMNRPDDVVGNVTARWRIFHITDAHISLGEADGVAKSGSRRMHGAFRSCADKHLEPGARRAPADTFRRLLQRAARENADAILLTGDIVNFPHNASVQYVLQELVAHRGGEGGRQIPLLYTAGNHDWLLEGLSRGRREQRSHFRRELLRPLYLAGSRGRRRALARSGDSEVEDIGILELGNPGDPQLLVIALDNSLLEVSADQAEFVWRELQRELPTLLAVHVPFMLPGVTSKDNRLVLCGDPRYRQDQDSSWQVERRERWPREGAPPSTARFVEDLVHRFAAPNGPLLAVLGGHEHTHRVDAVGTTRPVPPLKLQCDGAVPPDCKHAEGHRFGLPLHEGMVQYVTLPACEGGHRLVEVRDARVVL